MNAAVETWTYETCFKPVVYCERCDPQIIA